MGDLVMDRRDLLLAPLFAVRASSPAQFEPTCRIRAAIPNQDGIQRRSAATYLLVMQCPMYKRRNSHSGFRMERENLAGDAKCPFRDYLIRVNRLDSMEVT